MTVTGPDEGPITRVVVGAEVVDSEGARVGTVSAVKMGDPDAVTAEGQQARRGFVEGVVDTFIGAEPDVPPQRAEELLRKGYVKIDARGFLARDLYAGEDEVQDADEDRVRLSVPRGVLVPEQH